MWAKKERLTMQTLFCLKTKYAKNNIFCFENSTNSCIKIGPCSHLIFDSVSAFLIFEGWLQNVIQI